MPKFVHIDFGADDPERAGDFYRKVFGWKVEKLPGPVPYWLISTTGDPADMGAGIGQRDADWQTAIPTIEVPSVAEYEKKLKAAGGTVLVPATPMPGVGTLLTFKDCEGNILSLLEPAPGAPGA